MISQVSQLPDLIKASIAPSSTESSESDSDQDSDAAKWSIAARKNTVLDIVTLMAGNTDAAVALVEGLIKKKHKFTMDYG